MKFKKDVLTDIIILGRVNEYSIVFAEILETSKVIWRKIIFKDENSGKFYLLRFKMGRFYWKADEIECPEVRPVEKMVIVYEKV